MLEISSVRLDWKQGSVSHVCARMCSRWLCHNQEISLVVAKNISESFEGQDPYAVNECLGCSENGGLSLITSTPLSKIDDFMAQRLGAQAQEPILEPPFPKPYVYIYICRGYDTYTRIKSPWGLGFRVRSGRQPLEAFKAA